MLGIDTITSSATPPRPVVGAPASGPTPQTLPNAAPRPAIADPLAATLARAVAARTRRPLPATLRSAVEGLSGIAMDDVRVVDGSAEPARLGARSFARGTEIHLGPGGERDLAHEAWHVVQQKGGRVPATLDVRGERVNADARLEREADVMGARATLADAAGTPASPAPARARTVVRPVVQARWLVVVGKAQYFWEQEDRVDKSDIPLPAILESYTEINPLQPGTYLVDAGQRLRRGSRPPSRLRDPGDELELAQLGRGAPQTTVQTIERFVETNKGAAQPRASDQYNPFGRFATTPVCSFWPAPQLGEQQSKVLVEQLAGADKRFVAASGHSNDRTAQGNPKQVIVHTATGPQALDVLEEGPFGAIYGLGAPSHAFAAHDAARAGEIASLGIVAASQDYKIAENFRIDGLTLRAWAGTKRSQTQSQVMGVSAGQAVANAGYLRDEGFGWEWLHLIAHSMGGIETHGPQVAANLVAGTSECNSQMIVVEEFMKDYINRFDGRAALTVGVRMLDPLRHIADQINYDFELYNRAGEPVAVYHWTFHPLLRQQPSAIENRITRTAGRVVHEGGGTAYNSVPLPTWTTSSGDNPVFVAAQPSGGMFPAQQPHIPRSQPTAHGPYFAVDPENVLVDEAEKVARAGQPADLVAFLQRTSPSGRPSRFVLEELGDWIDQAKIPAYLAAVIHAFGERAGGWVIYGYVAGRPEQRPWMLELLARLYSGNVPHALARLCS